MNPMESVNLYDVDVFCRIVIEMFCSRTRQVSEARYKLTVEELFQFHEQIQSLPCTIKEADSVKELVESVKEFRKDSRALLWQTMPDVKALERCIEMGINLDIELPEIPKLKHVRYFL